MTGFEVCEQKCDECLFSPNAIVSDERRREILRECREGQRFFVCHKSTIAGGAVCCRGFYDADPEATQLMQIAGRLGMVVFVAPEDGTPREQEEDDDEDL